MHYEIEISEKEAKITVTLPLRFKPTEPKKSFGAEEARQVLQKEHKDLKLGEVLGRPKFLYNYIKSDPESEHNTKIWTFRIEKKKTTIRTTMPKTKSSREEHLLDLNRIKKPIRKTQKAGK
tara:strand:+ start:154 stop:516 length:363 start_codon:yes stop_codon:yes gene_type:complete